jgi:hypothetical protein
MVFMLPILAGKHDKCGHVLGTWTSAGPPRTSAVAYIDRIYPATDILQGGLDPVLLDQR